MPLTCDIISRTSQASGLQTVFVLYIESESVKMVSNATYCNRDLQYAHYSSERKGRVPRSAVRSALPTAEVRGEPEQRRCAAKTSAAEAHGRKAGRQSSKFSGLGGMPCDGMGCDAQASSYSGCGVQYGGMYSKVQYVF